MTALILVLSFHGWKKMNEHRRVLRITWHLTLTGAGSNVMKQDVKAYSRRLRATSTGLR